MTNPWQTIAHLSVKQIKELQSRKLRYFINRQAYPFSPYYQKLFNGHNIHPQSIRGLDDLRRIPFTSKFDFIDTEKEKDRFSSFILQPDKEKLRRYLSKPELLKLAALSLLRGRDYVTQSLAKEYRPIFITFTTGTTNKPVPFGYTAYDINNLYLSGGRMLTLFDMKDTERAVNLFPFAPHLAFWQAVFGGLFSNILMLSTGGGKITSSEANAGALVRMRPAVVLGVPSYIYHVIRVAKERNYDLSFVKKIVLGAGRVSDTFKMKLVDLLSTMGAKDVNIFGTYGFTEARSAWVECPAPAHISSGYHLYPDKEIFEIIDPDTGEVKKEGEDGELVYTALDGRGSVALRYRTGDFVKGGITYEPCPYCRMTVPRISTDITRLSDVKDLKFSKIKGTLVNINNFVSVLTDCREVVEWQIEIRKKDNDPFEIDELVLYICPKEGVHKARLSESIKKDVLSATEVTPNEVIFLSLPDIVKRLELETASKEKRIVDARPK